MNPPSILPRPGTRLIIHDKLEPDEEIFVAKKYLSNRRPSTACEYIGYVSGHGGDVWWCRHENGTVAAYLVTEVELAGEQG